ncbi:MAG: hypothetical protein E7415_06925 [Ruminococcaceae bacterium]|nr:hypothetical protein [Oscillospiraceae bacterium]
MKFFKSLSLFIAFSMLSTSVSASILGSTFINGYTAKIGEETYFCNNTYLSDQNGVGLQTENYITYTPNESITTMFGYGQTLFGGLTKTEAVADRLLSEGNDIIGGINADYFSLQTGVPMSNLIIDGEIISKDGTASYGFGFDENGNAFTGECYLTATLIRADGRTMNIDCINKYRQPYSMYLLNSDFSDQTHGTSLGLDIIIKADTDRFKLGETLNGTVEYAECYNGSIKIPEGTIVLTLDVNAPMFNDIADIAVGEEIEIAFSAPNDPRWETASIGMGSTGEYILSGGVVTPNLPSGAHPRTAIGIKENGEIVLYTIDGRQNGYSYGVKLSTLAERMKELGCTEAINLDGGGSTTIVARLPGDDGISLMNKPSDKAGRKVSTNIFLKNNLPQTGKLGQLMIYPTRTPYIMKGATQSFSIKASDTGYHAMDISGNIVYSVENGKDSTITNKGVFTAKDSGTVVVTATYDGISAVREVVCVESPTSITIKNEKTNENLSALKLKRNESVNLSAIPSLGYISVASTDECFIWDADENIGTIDNSGYFTASNSIGASGIISVSAGDTVKELKTYILPDGNEDEELLYSVIDAEISEGVLSGVISNEYNIDVQPENLIITADGTRIEASLDKKDFSAEIPENANRIRITATNDLGYTSVLSLTNDTDTVYENPFVDTDGNWARDILSYMYSQKLVSGENSVNGLIYNPNKEMTRSEFAVLICNFLKITPSEFASDEVPYTDLEEIPKWALNQFKALYSMGIIKGRDAGDGTSFADPKTGISRAEAFTVIARLLPEGLKKVEITGTDKEEIPKWATDGFMTLMADGTVSGYEDGSLKPLKKLTKAEAAKLLYSLY